MRNVTFMGIPFTVVDDEDVPALRAEHGDRVLHCCALVGDASSDDAGILPPALLARRTIKNCGDCGRQIWADPLAVPAGLIPVSKCIECVARNPTLPSEGDVL